MFGLSKKKFKKISEYPETWEVAQAEVDGKPIFLRHRSLKDAVGHVDYPFKIGIAVPFKSPTINGLLSDDEAEELGKIEDKLINLLDKEGLGVFAFSITFDGMREFVFYMSEWKPEFFEKEIKSFNTKSHQLQFIMETDPNWETFKQFVK
ncbi:MAG: DUF695 domain-containing protein [Candidatus Paceibacterota bacterium]|jgi:hypothetical protein